MRNRIIHKTNNLFFNKTYSEMMDALSRLDTNKYRVWGYKIGDIGYHITWWYIPANITLHFYYDAQGNRES